MPTSAVLLALDGTKRSVVDQIEFYAASFENARAAFVRPPDVETPTLLSWGQVTPEEARRVVGLQEFIEDRIRYHADIDRLFARKRATIFSLYVCDLWRE